MYYCIAYPGDRPPIVCEMPESFCGLVWRYRPATPAEAVAAIEHHAEEWSDWGVDPRLRGLAESACAD